MKRFRLRSVLSWQMKGNSPLGAPTYISEVYHDLVTCIFQLSDGSQGLDTSSTLEFKIAGPVMPALDRCCDR